MHVVVLFKFNEHPLSTKNRPDFAVRQNGVKRFKCVLIAYFNLRRQEDLSIISPMGSYKSADKIASTVAIELLTWSMSSQLN